MKQSIVMTDFEPPENWSFLSTLKSETCQDWIEKRCVSNKNRVGKMENAKRYLKYFIFSLIIFINRKKYDTILCWQQFYGIIIGFYSHFFHIRKQNPLYVMMFIYKPKKRIIGKLYYNFIRFSIASKYIDKIICFSSTEPRYYSNLFKVEINKFVYVPLGDDLTNVITVDSERHGIVSIGISNRDYNFLIKTFKDTQYDLRIYADHDERFAPNIIMSGKVLGEQVSDILNRTELLVIPLDDTNISAGQLTVLHAMQLGVPVVATDSNGLKDFIKNGENGYLLENDVTLWRNTIGLLLSNKNEWNRMSSNTRKMYEKNHTVISMAKRIAGIVTDQGEIS